MAGTIKHSWNGTILTIESDSGISSVDLKGPGGPIGPRGAQGPAGVIVNGDGSVELNGYATEQYVQDAIEGMYYEGKDGAVYTPMVDSDGNLTWTNNGGLANPVPINIRGPVGPQGPVGPKGEQGIQGVQGPQGIQGPKGNDGTVEFNELTAEQREMIRGPQGIQGEVGPVGPVGPEGPKGQDGTVAFEELTDAQREMLRGPQGIQGEIGPEGPQGVQGPEGPQGIQGPQGEDYVLTAEDQQAIANVAKGLIFTFNSSTGRLDITV